MSSSSTISSTSSFDMLSSRSRSSTFSSSDEEIVWPLSAASESLGSDTTSADDDYVLLNRSTASERSLTPLTSNLSRLSVNSSSKQRKSAGPLPERPESAATEVTGLRISRTGKQRRYKPRKGSSPVGLGERPIVNDISEASSVIDDGGGPCMYEDAVTFITTFLTNPSAHDSASHLTFLQSLIIELGLATSSLPASLKSAKAELKSKAFINIREYLAVRSQGLQAIQGIMYPSRSALIKDIRRKKNSASLHWVKQNGLQVLLVSCYH